MSRYVPVVRRFAANTVLFHSAVADAVGLHVTDLRGLRLLGEAPLTAGQLAEELGLTGAAVTALVDRLERGGYVTRQRNSKDRRKVTIQALPKRLREVEENYEAQGRAMTKLLSVYSEMEFSAIVDFLDRTADVLMAETRRIQGAPQGS